MTTFFNKIPKEGLFQFIIISVLFLASIYNRQHDSINWSESFFFANYVVAALFIGYFLLPRFFYQKKYIGFLTGFLGVLIAVVLVEEMILERIFYAGTRRASTVQIFPAILDILPIIVILVGFKFGWDAHQKQGELERLNTTVAESRLQFLKSQINPHFLFNNLNNLYAHALENSPKTPTIILELSSLLRYMLYDCQEKLVPLEKEIQSLRDFIRLQELQIEERGDIQFTVAGNSNGKMVVPLILVVFIENCFKHSTSSQSEGIQIDIDLDVREDHLVMQCQNTFSPDTNTTSLSKGIGLENVKNRLQLLYPHAHQLDIRPEGNTFKVRLQLQLHPQTT